MADPGDRDLAMVRAIYEMAMQKYPEEPSMLMAGGRILRHSDRTE
jgi:hypothetical protein